MNIKRMLAVLLTLAIVLVSLPVAVSAYSQYGEPECYLTDFKSSDWTVHTGSASINDNTGEIIANNNNTVRVKYTGDAFDLSESFAIQFGLTMQGDYENVWGGGAWLKLGNMKVKFYNAISTTHNVRYAIEKNGNQIAFFDSGVTHENGTVPTETFKAYMDGFFTVTYNDGKISMYNDKIKSDENPTGIIAWELNDGTSTTEVGGWADDDFAKCTPEIEKGLGGENAVHTILSDLYVCDYEFFVNKEKPVFETQTQVNIACIGDSITEGVGTYSAYRYYLFENLYKQGLKFNFVGPYTSSDPRLPEGYRSHAGYSGAVIGPNNNSGARSSYDWLPYYVAGSAETTADIALVMLGHNNYYQKIDIDNIDEVYKNFILRIFELAPDITVYCATIVSTTTGMSPDVEKGYTDNGINALIPGVVAELQAEGYDVKFFDLQKETNLSGANGDFPASDGVHPNEQGQKKIGDAWTRAIQDQVRAMNEAGEGTFTTTITPTISIAVDKKEMNLVAGGYRKRIYADVQMSDATIDTVVWSSSDPSIATVDIDGLVTPLAEGECDITATTLSGGYTASCKVTVAPAATGEDALQNAFSDIFTIPERWVGSGQGLGDSGIHMWFPNYSTKYDTRRHYAVEKEFNLSVDYAVSGNETSFTGYPYTSFSFGGLEMRLVYGAKTIELWHNSKCLGKWTHSFEGGSRKYEIDYNNGEIKIVRNNEVVIEAFVPYEELEKTSPVKLYSCEYNRYAQIYSIALNTINFDDESYVESSPVDTDKKDGFDTVLDGFNADNWTVTTGSISNSAINGTNSSTLVKYTGPAMDLSNGFQMQLDFNWNNYTRYYGEAVYYTIGDVTFRLRNAFDTTQSRNYPLYLSVYENSVFNEETGKLESGDLIATMVSDARGQINQSNSGILDFMNATYTLYYDGAKLYIKNSNLGTINFTLADGTLGTGIEIDPSQFADAGIQIFKDTMGNSGKMFSNFSLTARGAGDIVTSVPGDLNGDYTLNAADLLVFSQHLLDITTVDNIAAKGDLNADGIVDSTDLTILKMQIVGLSA